MRDEKKKAKMLELKSKYLKKSTVNAVAEAAAKPKYESLCIHCKNSKEYMPQESAFIERPGLKTY